MSHVLSKFTVFHISMRSDKKNSAIDCVLLCLWHYWCINIVIIISFMIIVLCIIPFGAFPQRKANGLARALMWNTNKLKTIQQIYSNLLQVLMQCERLRKWLDIYFKQIVVVVLFDTFLVNAMNILKRMALCVLKRNKIFSALFLH